MDQNQTPEPPPVVPGYLTERRLGSGATSQVYLLRREDDGALLALKLLDPAARGPLEAENLQGLEHEFLLARHGLVETSRGPGLLLDHCPGGSAARLLAVRGPLGVGEAVTVCAPIAGVLAYLHEEGVVHGDVSPGNILFTAEGMPQLADLGLRAVLGREAPGGGTPGFMAPEPSSPGTGLLQPARDVYGLSAVLWYLLTGRTAGSTRQRPPLSTLLPGIPAELVELIESGLAEDPELRPSAADMARRIFAGTAAQPIELQDVVEPEDLGFMATVVHRERSPRRFHWSAFRRRPRRAARRAGRPVVPAAWLGALTLLVVAAAGIWIWSGGPKDAGRPPPVAVGSEQAKKPAASPAGSPSPPVPSTQTPSTPAPSESPGPTPEAPEAALARLAGVRDAALSTRNLTKLLQVHVPGSPALAHDRATVEALRERGLHFVDLKTSITRVRRAGSPGGGAVGLSAHSSQGAYRVEDGQGRVRAVSQGQGTTVGFELRLLDQGWRIWSVSAAE